MPVLSLVLNRLTSCKSKLEMMSGISQVSLNNEIFRVSQSFDRFSQDFKEICKKFSQEFQCSVWILDENLSETFLSNHSGVALVSISVQKVIRMNLEHFLLLYKDLDFNSINAEKSSKVSRVLLNKLSRFCIQHFGNDYCRQIIDLVSSGYNSTQGLQLRRHLEHEVFNAKAESSVCLTSETEPCAEVIDSTAEVFSSKDFSSKNSITPSQDSETILRLRDSKLLDSLNSEEKDSAEVKNVRTSICREENHSSSSISFLFKEKRAEPSEIPPLPVIPHIHPTHQPKVLSSNPQPPSLLKKKSAGTSGQSGKTDVSPVQVNLPVPDNPRPPDLLSKNKIPNIPKPQALFNINSKEVNPPTLLKQEELKGFDSKETLVNLNELPSPPRGRNEKDSKIEVKNNFPQGIIGLGKKDCELAEENLKKQEEKSSPGALIQPASSKIPNPSFVNENIVNPGHFYQKFEEHKEIPAINKNQDIDSSKSNPPNLPSGQLKVNLGPNEIPKSENLINSQHQLPPVININPQVMNFNKSLVSSGPIQFYNKNHQPAKPKSSPSLNQGQEKEASKKPKDICDECIFAQSKQVLMPDCKCKMCELHLQLTAMEGKCFRCGSVISSSSQDDLTLKLQGFV